MSLYEDDIVHCEVCGSEIEYDYNERECPLCQKIVHKDCLARCEQCGTLGCKGCMLLDDDTGLWFCETTSYDEWKKGLVVSECRGKYYADDAMEIYRRKKLR